MSTAAMIMGAGKGTRMRPLTATRPKPLVEVAGTTLIDHVLDHLRTAGVRDVVVNVHYFADAMEAHLKRRANDLIVTVSDERDRLLETGGGLVKALPSIASDPFLTINADNWWVDGPDNAIEGLIRSWDDERMDGLLLLVPLARAHGYRGRGDFHLDAVGRMSRRKAGRVAPFVWTGIQLLAKRLIADPPAASFSTNVFWDRAIARGRLFGLVHHGLWVDVGTPKSIALTEALLADA